jgi:Telomere-capping, CST complex subunit
MKKLATKENTGHAKNAGRTVLSMKCMWTWVFWMQRKCHMVREPSGSSSASFRALQYVMCVRVYVCVCVRCVTSVCRMVSGFCRLWGRPREGCNAFVPLSQLEAHLDYLSFSCGSISFEHTHTHTHTLSLSLLNSLSQETQAPVVKARISRNVNGMDLNLYHETVLLLRQYLESST